MQHTRHASDLLGHAPLGGFSLMRYIKPALTFEQQVTLLQARGLTIGDRAHAEMFLSHVSYYRLSAYFRPFRQAPGEQFQAASFGQVEALYQFDKQLRLLVSDALEVVEVHFRTQITYHLALRGGAFAHLDPIYFLPTFGHSRFLATLRELDQRSSDRFVQHFRRKYAEEEYLPLWMCTELMSFGSLSHMYSGLTTDLQREVAADLNSHQSVLRSWLHMLSYVRNICAHHGRLWNRELAITPRIPHTVQRWPYKNVDPKRTYAVIVILCDLLLRLNPGNICQSNFLQLLHQADRMQLAGMWVPLNWNDLRPWSIHPPTQLMSGHGLI